MGLTSRQAKSMVRALFKSEDSFYEDVLAGLVRQRILDPGNDSVLVVAGGGRDQRAFQQHGFRDVTLSNLDTRMTGTEYAPYRWSRQNAEKLDFPDGTFDFAVVHSGLHHCRSPHLALLEMLRVARRGVLLFEPYDNWVTRLGVRLGLGQEYETAAVYYNSCAFGGLCNTPIANYVYRFTRHEVRKTIRCGAPYGPYDFCFIHELRMPWGQLRGRRNRAVFLAALFAWPALKIATLCVPILANCFAAVVLKPTLPERLYPWLETAPDGGYRANQTWLANKYKPLAGKRTSNRSGTQG